MLCVRHDHFYAKNSTDFAITQNEISIAEIMLGLAPPFQATSCIPSFEATNIIILYIYFYCHIAPIFSPIFAPKLVFSSESETLTTFLYQSGEITAEMRYLPWSRLLLKCPKNHCFKTDVKQ